MDKNTRKEMIREYKEQPIYYGVIQIKNKENGKIFIETVPNTKNRWHVYQLSLDSHFYAGSPLQKEWDEYGADAFEFEVLWQKKNDDVVNMKHELKELKKEWLEKLQPFGEKGYNKPMKE